MTAAPKRDQFSTSEAYYAAHDRWSESFATPIPASELGAPKRVTLAPARPVKDPVAGLALPPVEIPARELVAGMRILTPHLAGKVSHVETVDGRDGAVVRFLVEGKIFKLRPDSLVLVPGKQGRPKTVDGRKVTLYLDAATLEGAAQLGANRSEGLRNAVMVASAMQAYKAPQSKPSDAPARAEYAADQTLRQVAAMLGVKQEKRLAGVPLAVRKLQVALAAATPKPK